MAAPIGAASSFQLYPPQPALLAHREPYGSPRLRHRGAFLVVKAQQLVTPLAGVIDPDARTSPDSQRGAASGREEQLVRRRQVQPILPPRDRHRAGESAG